jgi:glucose uptake protein GlcU
LQDHSEEFGGASKQGLPYVFAHYSGIFLTATAFFLIYGGYKRNRPVINAKTVIPAYITGTLWAVAQSAWFVANESLSPAVSFPIIAMMPGVIASLWGVLYFREIRVSFLFFPTTIPIFYSVEHLQTAKPHIKPDKTG